MRFDEKQCEDFVCEDLAPAPTVAFFSVGVSAAEMKEIADDANAVAELLRER